MSTEDKEQKTTHLQTSATDLMDKVDLLDNPPAEEEVDLEDEEEEERETTNGIGGGGGGGVGLDDDDDLEIFKSAMEINSSHQDQDASLTSDSLNSNSNQDQNQSQSSIAATPTSPTTINTTTTTMEGMQQVNNTANNHEHHRQDNTSTPVDPNQYLDVTVTEPQKQGDGMSAFMVYRVTTRTNIALFRRKEFAVWRRFSDFLGLHSKLADKYLRKGRIVPPAPEKNVIGTTKLKISGQSDAAAGGHNSNQAGDFVEKRRHCLERFLNRIAAHPVLRIDPDFRDFLEIESDLPRSTSTSALSSAGVARFFSKVGETVSKISYRMDENDPWFEEKIQNIEALENQLRKVHNSVELLVSNRKELAQATGVFAKSSAILSNSEEHTGLARAMAQLADVEDKVEQMHNEEANLDFFLFSELLRDYIGLICTVKEAFHERAKAYQGWQHAQQTLNKKRELKAKLELQVRNDKVAQVREEVVEWEAKVERAQEEFEAISSIIKKELETFEAKRVKDFKSVIVKYLEELLSRQQELVKYWEAFLPEAKAIA